MGNSSSVTDKSAATPLGTYYQNCVPREKSINVERFYMQSLARELLPDERVSDCLRKIAPRAKDDDGKLCVPPGVKVMYSPDVNRAHYKNLYICARVWHCPVCAAKITERRREELTLALARTEYSALLITYTLRHHQGDSLKLLMDALLKSVRAVKSGRWWAQFRNGFGWVGSVRSLEVTHGENGWHPHCHELVLLSGGKLDDEKLLSFTEELRARWSKLLAKHGCDATWAHGLVVQNADSAVRDYVAKFGHEPLRASWTAEYELTKSPVKRAKHGGRTPLQLLWDYGNGDMRAGQLFQEYALLFKGRHQLQWSRGLRALLGIGTAATDAQLAREDRTPSWCLANLDRSQWKRVLAADLRGQLLDIASAGNHDHLAKWLSEVGVIERQEDENIGSFSSPVVTDDGNDYDHPWIARPNWSTGRCDMVESETGELFNTSPITPPNPHPETKTCFSESLSMPTNCTAIQPDSQDRRGRASLRGTAQASDARPCLDSAARRARITGRIGFWVLNGHRWVCKGRFTRNRGRPPPIG